MSLANFSNTYLQEYIRTAGNAEIPKAIFSKDKFRKTCTLIKGSASTVEMENKSNHDLNDSKGKPECNTF